MAVLQACLNGARTKSEHPNLPVTPTELAAAAVGAVRAGAQDIHLHPKAPDGIDSLAAGAVDAAVGAVRAAVPHTPIGVTTGTWDDSASVVASIAEWRVLPDHASVNWHLDGAEDVASALRDRGIGDP